VPALRFDHTDGFGSEWIPRFGLLLRPFSWLEVKGNVEKSYRVPNFDELYFDEEFVRGNPNLDPEDAFNADIGIELGLEQLGPLDDAWLELAFFRNDIEESILFQRVNAFVVAATNTGPALVRGVELAGGFRLFRWLHFYGNWTVLDTEVDRTGDPLPGRAQSEYLLRLELGPPSGLFKLVAEHQYTSDLPVTADGGTTVSSRRVWNASAALDLLQLPYLDEHLPGERLLVSVTVDNLTDQSLRDAQFFPQPGRWLTVRVEWQL
jgi:outer membrane receptor protein involved in Fe transport